MKLLVRRYVTAEQRKRDEFGVTEDDVMEIRQDISTLRFELVDILRSNGMKTPVLDPNESSCKYFLVASIFKFSARAQIFIVVFNIIFLQWLAKRASKWSVGC